MTAPLSGTGRHPYPANVELGLAALRRAVEQAATSYDQHPYYALQQLAQAAAGVQVLRADIGVHAAENPTS